MTKEQIAQKIKQLEEQRTIKENLAKQAKRSGRYDKTNDYLDQACQIDEEIINLGEQLEELND